jgi:hypothetical protein
MVMGVSIALSRRRSAAMHFDVKAGEIVKDRA